DGAGHGHAGKRQGGRLDAGPTADQAVKMGDGADLRAEQKEIGDRYGGEIARADGHRKRGRAEGWCVGLAAGQRRPVCGQAHGLRRGAQHQERDRYDAKEKCGPMYGAAPTRPRRWMPTATIGAMTMPPKDRPVDATENAGARRTLNQRASTAVTGTNPLQPCAKPKTTWNRKSCHAS